MDDTTEQELAFPVASENEDDGSQPHDEQPVESKVGGEKRPLFEGDDFGAVDDDDESQSKKRKIYTSDALDEPIILDGNRFEDPGLCQDASLSVSEPLNQSATGGSAGVVNDFEQQTPLATADGTTDGATVTQESLPKISRGDDEVQAIPAEPTIENSLLYTSEPEQISKQQDEVPAMALATNPAVAVDGNEVGGTAEVQPMPQAAAVGPFPVMMGPFVGMPPSHFAAMPQHPMTATAAGFAVGQSHLDQTPTTNAPPSNLAEKPAQNSTERKQEMVPPGTTGIKDVRESDVLSGRGGGTNCHPGNRYFRDLINVHRRTYLKARKNDKPAISRSIVKTVRDANGRFLRKDDETNLWFEIGDEAAREKTSQALRQKAPEMRRLILDNERDGQQLRAQQEEQFRLQQMSQMNPQMPQAYMNMMAGMPAMNPMFAMAMANQQGFLQAASIMNQPTGGMHHPPAQGALPSHQQRDSTDKGSS